MFCFSFGKFSIKIVAGVYLRLFGEANCKFVVPVNKVATVQTNHEEYLDERIVCFEGIKGRGE